MRFASFERDGTVYPAVVSADGKTLYPISSLGLEYSDMTELIENISESDCSEIEKKLAEGGLTGYPVDEKRLLAPIPKPSQDILCLGINYSDHAKESADFTSIAFTGEKEPAIYFAKRCNEAVAPFGEIDGHLDIVKDLDYEVELAVIIGRDALNVPIEKAEDYIFGYTVLNDVSARSLQSAHKQWYRGKSLDGFTPIGPWIVTADEISYPPALELECYVNGELRQKSRTDMLIHGISEIIAEASEGMTLKAGTIIATGTPSGVAMGMKNPVYLKKGDVVECVIEGIGAIRNTVK